jgi:hypothetical protein
MQQQASLVLPSRRFPVEFIATILCALLVSLAGAVLMSPTSFAAGCQTSSHCYGIVEWAGAVHGAQTYEETNYLNGSSGTHISNEQWVLDTNDTCYYQNGAAEGESWVEAGYATRTNTSGTWYFWADCRPGSQEYDHWQYIVPSGDYGQYNYYTIDLASSNTYDILATNSLGMQLWSGLSTSNSMSPNFIEIGLETTNRTSTSSSPAYFESNEWESTINNWHFQTNGGTVSNASPPTFTWDTVPSNNNPGGLGHTTCC